MAIQNPPKDRRVLDEEFKIRVESQFERLFLIIEGDENQRGLIHDVRRLTRLTEGGTIAVKILLGMGTVLGSLAVAFAWLHDRVTFK